MTDEQPYDVLSTYEGFEVRRYPVHLVAEVEVTGSFDSAGSAAFSALFGYITGDNHSSASIAMTSPVVQQVAPSENIAMTSPVIQTATTAADTFTVAFVLPEVMTLESAPTPTNRGVQVREVPERIAAAATYSGYDSQELYAKHLAELLAALAAVGLSPEGPPMAARFDAPQTPGPQRRNEVVQPIVAPADVRR